MLPAKCGLHPPQKKSRKEHHHIMNIPLLKKGCLSGSTLKIIAIIAMAIDHFAASIILYGILMQEHPVFLGHPISMTIPCLFPADRRFLPYFQQKEICHPVISLCSAVGISFRLRFIRFTCQSRLSERLFYSVSRTSDHLGYRHPVP